MLTTRLACLTALSVLIFCGSTASAIEAEPDFYVLNGQEFGWWQVESRVSVKWNKKPEMTGLECRASSRREGHLNVTLRHPVESSEFRYLFEFKLPDGQLISREVQTIAVGGRTYQFTNLQVRVIPWFGVHGPDDVILAYGMGRAMVRPNENYGWLPAETLFPQFFEAEEIRLSVSGQFEIDHGNYETRFEELRVDMDGFREAMKWCSEQVNPADTPKFPDQLEKALAK